jgi:Flavin-binding monooxygenase-like
MKSVCVIGAGPSGIAAIKNLLDAGLEVTAYDLQDDVGGNWRFSEDTGHSSVFETTHIISSKYHSEFHDYPFPKEYPDYPSHAQLRAYFEGYARHFDLYPRIQFQTLVNHCEPLSDGRWRVTTTRDGVQNTRDFDALVVCNGHHWKPRVPEYPGAFTGEFLHSHEFKRAEPFRDKRILVIGGGNSACDIAVETSRVSRRTDVSWRRGYWVVPKFVLGKPADVLSNGVKWIPSSIRFFLYEKLMLLLNGRNRDIGLPDPDHRIGATHVLLNSELVYFVRHGKIRILPDVSRLEGHIVHFKDGSSAEYDTIIAATGYWISHPFLDEALVDFSSGAVPLYLRMLPAKIPNLYFLGLFQPLGCIWPGAELQAKIVARHLTGQWTPPGDLETLIRNELEHPDVAQIATPRHTITVDDAAFRARLKAQLPTDFRQPQPRGQVRVAPEASPQPRHP